MYKCRLEAFSGVDIVLGAFRKKGLNPWAGYCNCQLGLVDTCALQFGLHGNGEIKFRMRRIGCGQTPIIDVGLYLNAAIRIGGYGVDYSNHLPVFRDTAVGSRWNC